MAIIKSKVEVWAEEALACLKRFELMPTPENFAVFYHYFSGAYPNLKMAVDLLMKQGTGFTQQQTDDLYRSYLGLEAETQVLKEANSAIEAELTRVIGVIDTAAAGTNQYSKTLDAFSGKLATTTSLEQIRDAVTKVVGETRVMAKQNERLQQQLAQATEQLTEMRYNLDVVHKESQIDPLTEVGNRKYFNKEIERVVTESRTTKGLLTLLMADIDHFKKFNDTYGHQIGDQVLKLVAHTLVENLKGRDIIARYGGEEFCILLPETGIADGEKVANLLRAHLGTKQVKKRNTNETLGVITVSIGAAEFSQAEDIENFISRADAALYKAKQTGRNRVVCSPKPTEAELAALLSSGMKKPA